MLAIAGLAILHGAVAAAVVESLLRLWRVQDPAERLALRWLALTAPLFLPPVFRLLAPVRGTDGFATSWAVFAGAHWDVIRIGGGGLAAVATAIFGATGALLYLRDALPFLGDRIHGRGDPPLPATHPVVIRVRALLDELARSMGAAAPPALAVIARDEPTLLCTGADTPTVVVSLGTIGRLDEDALSAALAHELAHAAHRDPLAGWALMVFRTFAFFSPAAQIVARQIVQEVEYRADVAAARGGRSAALGRAIAALAGAPGADTDLAPPAAGPGRSRRILDRAEREALGARCARVFDAPEPQRSGIGPFRLAIAACGLAALLFFIV